ncbi:MAG: glycosyltransferase family 2 protein [Nibricoccus sp.]
MKPPLISICIAAYNAEKYLEATLRSVLSQTYKNWELIVIEDSSKDRTEELVTDFSLKVPQTVVYGHHSQNSGLAATRNTSMERASGEWVAFLDADDLWKPEHLEMLVSASQIETCDGIFSGSVEYDDATWTKLSTHFPSDRDLIDLPVAIYTGRLVIVASAVMVARKAFERFGPISPEFSVCSDTEYLLRILSMSGRLMFSGANTCIYRQHSRGLSSDVAKSLIESARVCERYSNWNAIPRLLARARTASLYRTAGSALLKEHPDEALEPLAQSLRLHPFSPKTIGLWAKALLNQGHKRQRAA